jgi:hypothetical protein
MKATIVLIPHLQSGPFSYVAADFETAQRPRDRLVTLDWLGLSSAVLDRATFDRHRAELTLYTGSQFGDAVDPVILVEAPVDADIAEVFAQRAVDVIDLADAPWPAVRSKVMANDILPELVVGLRAALTDNGADMPDDKLFEFAVEHMTPTVNRHLSVEPSARSEFLSRQLARAISELLG